MTSKILYFLARKRSFFPKGFQTWSPEPPRPPKSPLFRKKTTFSYLRNVCENTLCTCLCGVDVSLHCSAKSKKGHSSLFFFIPFAAENARQSTCFQSTPLHSIPFHSIPFYSNPLPSIPFHSITFPKMFPGLRSTHPCRNICGNLRSVTHFHSIPLPSIPPHPLLSRRPCALTSSVMG